MPEKKLRIKGVLAAHFLNYYWIENKRAGYCAPVPWDLSTERLPQPWIQMPAELGSLESNHHASQKSCYY